MADLDPRYHLVAAPGQTRCGLSFAAYELNPQDVWMEHAHAGSCTMCMLSLDRSTKQYTKAGTALQERQAPPAAPPAPAPEPVAVLIPDAPADEDTAPKKGKKK
jgi:hypothetical protein